MHTHTDHILEQHPLTLIDIKQLSPIIRKQAKTIARCVTDKPDSLPAVTYIGRRVFFKVKDVIAFLTRETPTKNLRAK